MLSGLRGFTRMATTAPLGARSRSSWSLLRTSSADINVMPVMLPAGRLRLVTSPLATGINSHHEHDWDGRCRGLGCKGCVHSSGGDDDSYPKIDQSLRQRRQSSKLTITPPERNVKIVALDVTGFFQTLSECSLNSCRLAG